MADTSQNANNQNETEETYIPHALNDYSGNEYYGNKPLIYRVFENIFASIFYSNEYDMYANTHGLGAQDPVEARGNEAREINPDFKLPTAQPVRRPEALDRVIQGEELDYSALPEHVSKLLDSTISPAQSAPRAAAPAQPAATPDPNQPQPDAPNTTRAQPTVTPGLR